MVSLDRENRAWADPGVARGLRATYHGASKGAVTKLRCGNLECCVRSGMNKGGRDRSWDAVPSDAAECYSRLFPSGIGELEKHSPWIRSAYRNSRATGRFLRRSARGEVIERGTGREAYIHSLVPVITYKGSELVHSLLLLRIRRSASLRVG